MRNPMGFRFERVAEDVRRKVSCVETDVPECSRDSGLTSRAVVIDECPGVGVEAKGVSCTVWHCLPTVSCGVKGMNAATNRAGIALPVGNEVLKIDVGVTHLFLEVLLRYYNW